MASMYLHLIVNIIFFTTLATCQYSNEGYVGVNFNAAAGAGFGKGAYVEADGAHSAGVNGGATVVKTVEVPAPAAQSSFHFEKNIQSIAHPVIVEKEVEYKPAPTPEHIAVKEIETVPVQQNVYVKKVYRRPGHPRRHYAYVNAEVAVPPPPPARVNFFSKLFAVGAAPAPEPVLVQSETEVQKVAVPQSSVQHTYTATANVNKNGQLFNDIFNIPISTLQAVNTLVNNIVGGVSITKQVNTHAVKTVPTTDVHANANANAYVHAEGHAHV